MELVDTHCHPHFDDFLPHLEAVLQRAAHIGVKKMICVGVNLADSRKAIDFAARYDNLWASAGVHPHDAKNFPAASEKQLEELLDEPRIVAAGEIGLDYYKLYSTKPEQQRALRTQLRIGLDKKLPFIFHTRDAWSDFWQIFDEFPKIGGVVHSFTGGPKQLEQALARGLFVALNGIVTYTNDQALLKAAKEVPLDKLLLETDAPFLLPAGADGKVCEPRHVKITAEFLAELRGEDLADLAAATTKNAEKLFNLR